MASEPYVGVLLADLHFPANRSLKDKRSPLASLRDTMHARFRASFAEVGHLDSWQLARVLVVMAASSSRQGQERLDEVDRYLHGRDYEVARILVKSVDPVETIWASDS